MNAVAPLRSPAFRRYLIGQLPSVTCSWIQVVALSWTVVDRYPMALGWVVALQFAPSIVLGPWFGALTDRSDRKLILMFAEVGLGLVAAGYTIAAATDLLTLPLICVLAAAWGVVNALDTPARQSLVPLLVDRPHVASAAALTGIVLLLGMTAGSALGAALVAWAGAAAAFGLNAASFLFDVVLLATIRAGTSVRVGRSRRQMRDGLAYVWRSPRLRGPLLALAVIATFAFTIQVSVPILLRTTFAGGPALVGAGFTAVTAGGLAGAAVAAAGGAPGSRSLRRAGTAMAAAMTVCVVAPTVPIVLAALTGIGFAWSLLIASTVAILQTSEPSMMGRVMSWFAVVLVGGLAAGGPVAGAVAALAGPRAPFVLGAVAAGAAIGIVRPGKTHSGLSPAVAATDAEPVRG